MDIVVFQLHQQYFGLPGHQVEQVIEPLLVTPLPFVPPYVAGVVSTAGQVVTQIDLAILLGIPHTLPPDQGKLLLVRSQKYRYALHIDQVMVLVHVDESVIHHVDPDRSEAVEGEDEPAETPLAGNSLMTGEFDWQGRTVVVLDFGHMDLQNMVSHGVPAGGGGLLGQDDEAHQLQTAVTTRPAIQCLLVQAGDERYALRMSEVHEVVEPGTITPLPHAPGDIAGTVFIRGHPYLALSLPHLLGRKASDGGYQAMVLIDFRQARLGLMIDRILGIASFDETAMHPIDADDKELEHYLQDKQGHMVGLLHLPGLLHDKRWRRYGAFLPKNREVQQSREAVVERQPFLAFQVGDELCTLPLGTVNRVFEFKPYETVPENTNPILSGMVQLHGEVLPVVDLRQWMAQEIRDAMFTTYIVVQAGTTLWAMVADRVLRVMQIPVDAIETMSRESEETTFVSGVGRLNGALFSVLTVEPLMRVCS